MMRRLSFLLYPYLNLLLLVVVPKETGRRGREQVAEEGFSDDEFLLKFGDDALWVVSRFGVLVEVFVGG